MAFQDRERDKPAPFDPLTATQEDVDAQLARFAKNPINRVADDPDDGKRRRINKRNHAMVGVRQAQARLRTERNTPNPPQTVDAQNRGAGGSGIISEGDFGPGAIRLNSVTPVNSKVRGR